MNFLLISETDSPFVYTTQFTLKTNNTTDMPPKRKNNGYGDPTTSAITGVIVEHIDPPSQFMNVAPGTIFEGIISGTYSQMIGPTVTP